MQILAKAAQEERRSGHRHRDVAHSRVPSVPTCRARRGQPSGQKQPHDINVVLVAGQNQRRDIFAIDPVDIGAAGDQGAGDFQPAVAGGIDKCRVAQAVMAVRVGTFAEQSGDCGDIVRLGCLNQGRIGCSALTRSGSGRQSRSQWRTAMQAVQHLPASRKRADHAHHVGAKVGAT